MQTMRLGIIASQCRLTRVTARFVGAAAFAASVPNDPVTAMTASDDTSAVLAAADGQSATVVHRCAPRRAAPRACRRWPRAAV